MEFRIDETGKCGVLTLDGPLTVRSAEEARSFLLSAMESVDEVLLDLGGVTEVDLCGLQLLCSARRTASTRGKGLSRTGTLNTSFVKASEEAGGCYHSGCGAAGAEQCAWKRG